MSKTLKISASHFFFQKKRFAYFVYLVVIVEQQNESYMETTKRKSNFQDAIAARESQNSLRSAISKSKGPNIVIKVEEQKVEIPRTAAILLVDILSKMANGDSVTLTSIEQEMSTQEAANLLQVSRPHLVKLLDTGKIPSKMVGAHRRVKRIDVLQYDADLREVRRKNLDILAREAQEMTLGYE